VDVDALIDGWQAAWSGKDPEAFAEVCASGIQYEDPLTTEPLKGLEALTGHAGRLWAAFPDARLERTGKRLRDDRFVAAPCKALGTHREPLEGLPATNRFVVVHCSTICCCACAASMTSTMPPPSLGCCPRTGRWVRRRSWCCAGSACALAAPDARERAIWPHLTRASGAIVSPPIRHGIESRSRLKVSGPNASVTAN
jgi:hypothetical protein